MAVVSGRRGNHVMSRLAAIISAVVICLIVSLGWLASHYHDNATEFKRQRDKVTEQLSLAKDTIADMQTRQRDVAALDAKYTKELADAKAENDALQRKLDNGGRVLVKASVQCQPQPKPPAPPAWAMMPPSNSLQLLDETFSVSGPESSATKQP